MKRRLDLTRLQNRVVKIKSNAFIKLVLSVENDPYIDDQPFSKQHQHAKQIYYLILKVHSAYSERQKQHAFTVIRQAGWKLIPEALQEEEDSQSDTDKSITHSQPEKSLFQSETLTIESICHQSASLTQRPYVQPSRPASCRKKYTPYFKQAFSKTQKQVSSFGVFMPSRGGNSIESSIRQSKKETRRQRRIAILQKLALLQMQVNLMTQMYSDF